MNLLRTCIATVVLMGVLVAPAGADPWFSDRAAKTSGPAVIAGDRPGDFARTQVTPPISGDRPGEVARIRANRPVSGDRPADRAPTAVVLPVAAAGGTSFDWVAAGVGAASAFALVGVVFGGLVLAGRRSRLASHA